MNIPREIDLTSLLSSSEPFREFVIDPHEQVIFVRPQPTGLYGLWTRFVAWLCHGNAERETYAIQNGYLPLTFNGTLGIDAKYLIDGLRRSLGDLPPFDSEEFRNEENALKEGIKDPKKTPVALAKNLVQRCTRGSLCDVETMEAIRKLVTRWLEGPQSRALGFDRTCLRKLIRLAVVSTNTKHLRGVDDTSEALARAALEAAINLVFTERNKNDLSARIKALPGDVTSPHFAMMKERIGELATASMAKGKPDKFRQADVLDRLIADAYVEARAELLAKQVGIEPQWAREIASASLDLKTVGSVTLPFIPAFPSGKEADALLDQANREKLLASCCVVARSRLHAKKLDPFAHVRDKSELERREIILAAELDTAVMVVRRSWADQEAVAISSRTAAGEPNVAVAGHLIAHRNEPMQVTKLDDARRFEKRSAKAGVEFEAQRLITAQLHVDGMLPVSSIEHFGAAAKALSELLITCADAPKGSSSAQIFAALLKGREAVDRWLSAAPASPADAGKRHMQLQALLQVAVIGLVREHRGKPKLANIVNAFDSVDPHNRTQSIWRALRSPELAANPEARELDRLFALLIVELGAELNKAEHQRVAPVGHAIPMPELSAKMHQGIDRALSVAGASLADARRDLLHAVRGHFYRKPRPKGILMQARRLLPSRASPH